MLIPGQETKENRRHSTTYVPYSLYICRIPMDFPNVPMHWHNEFELDYVVRGQGAFTMGSEKRLAREGDLMFLPPNRLHAAYPCQGPLHYNALVFHPALLGTGLGDRCAVEYLRPLAAGDWQVPAYIPAGDPDAAPLREAAQHIFSCALGQAPQPELLLRAELLRLLWLLSTRPESGLQPCPEQDGGQAVRVALDYMQQHYREPVSIRQLAKAVHLSESYFMGSFKRAVGLSAMEYLAQLRINAACEALLTTEQPVSEIAFSVGFGNLSNFNRQFKRNMGCTPRDFRASAGG